MDFSVRVCPKIGIQKKKKTIVITMMDKKIVHHIHLSSVQTHFHTVLQLNALIELLAK